MQEQETNRQEKRLIERLKSAMVLVTIDEARKDFSVGTDNLVAWIEDFNEWTKERLGINQGRSLSSLYNREISLMGQGLLTLPDRLKAVAVKAIKLGYAFSITVDILELYRNFEVIKQLADFSYLSSLGVMITSLEQVQRISTLESFVTEVINLKRPLGLIGTRAVMRESGLLDVEAMNGTDITFYSSADSKGDTALIVPPNPLLPCANRFRLYVDYDGYIYPCLGLLGLTGYALGNVQNQLWKTVLNNRSYPLDFMILMTNGPTLSEKCTDHRVTSLPWTCERHRLDIINGVLK
jgi:radical SAM protein with 4Fe4S-binding SPASM domain